MQRNIGFHSLLDIWCLLQAVKNVLQITKGKIIKAWRYFSVELIFLGTSCSSNKVWFYQATHRDMLLRSCVPVIHLLSCLNPLICMFFFPAKEEPEILCFLSPSPSCTTSTFVSFSAFTNGHPTPYPSFQACISTASFLVLFLSVGPEKLEQVLQVEQFTFGEGCQCRNAALWPLKATSRFGSIHVL